MVSASEAYPELERAVLRARTEIWASFRIFDLSTRLRSDEALAVGRDWFDLIVHTLRRGVSIHLALSDFDPVARPALHRGTWRSLRMLWAAEEVSGTRGKVHAVAALHPGRVGALARLALWPYARRHLARTLSDLRNLPADIRACQLRDSPALGRLLRTDGSGGLRLAGGPPPICPATHHQKIAVFDRSTVYMGGLDLDDRRYDAMPHDRPGRETWHDVQVLARGPVAEEAQRHLEEFLSISAGMGAAGPGRTILRTLAARRRFPLAHLGPRTVVDELDRAHQTFALRSGRLIYLETQFFRDRALARTFAKAARAKPGLGLIVMLPAAPEEIAFEDRSGADQRMGEYLQSCCLDILTAGFGNRLFVGTLGQPRDGHPLSTVEADRIGAPMVYLHSKVSIFDDHTAIVSSANLNGRSLRWDSEAGMLIDKPAKARELRLRLMRNWLPPDADEAFYDAGTAVQSWATLAADNLNRAPAERRGYVLPYRRGAPRGFDRLLGLLPEALA